MDFFFTPEQEAFRQEVREFIKKEFPPERHKAYRDFLSMFAGGGIEQKNFNREMAKKLGARGWLSLAWPEEYGGRNAPILQHILVEELAYHKCPGWDTVGIGMLAPMLLRSGTEEQKRRFLPPMARGEVSWCELLSERDAGSDLASLQTRAMEKDDYFIINGQKCWTSGAHYADWGFILVRTDPTATPKHRGLTFLLVDMKSPGISITPIINMTGEHEFNEVFFDDVRVPKENMVGEKNRGWYVVVGVLDFERSALPFNAIAKRKLDDFIEYVRQQKLSNPILRHRLAELIVECEVARLIHYRVVWMQDKGLIPNYESSIDKLFMTELNQKVTATVCRELGLYGTLVEGSKWAPLNGHAPYLYLRAIGDVIAMGSSEIERVVIAQRGLGLPRG
jgi:alkylation response protein AidB-like acyl-CoA dehydrogenase